MKTSVKMRSKMAFILLLVCIGTLYSVKANAATVTSTGSGTWELDGNWDSGLMPQPSDDVVITDGNHLTTSSNITIASLTLSNVEDAIILTIGSGYTLTVTGNVTINSAEFASLTQITCSGNLIINGNLIFNGEGGASQCQLSMGDGSSAILNGDVIYSGTGRFYSSNTSNIYTITYNGTGDRTIRFTGHRYRNLIFNTNGNINMSNAMTATTMYGDITVNSGNFNNNGYAITGNSGRNFTVNSGGTLNLSGTTGLPSGFTMVTNSGSTVHYSGASQTVGNLSYSNLQISGSGTKTLAANTTVGGNLTINGSTLDVHSTNNYSLSISGNFINSATFLARAGTVTFNGTGAQSITSGGTTFYDAVFNNTNVSGITLNDDMAVTNTATFTDGVVSTGVNRLIIENTAANAISGHSSISFVNGRLRRFIATNTSTYAFPVGNGTSANNYQLAEIVNNNMTGVSYIDSRFGALTNHNNADMTASDSYMTYLSVAPAGVWHLTPNAQPGNSYDVRLYLTNMGIFSDNQFGVVKRDDGSLSAADWTAPGNMNSDGGAGRMVGHGYSLRMGLTSFSEFGIGRASYNGNPLPIELVSFTAKVNNDKKVVLDWMTALEINNDFFTVERSTDGTNFEEVAQIEGAGNSVQANTYTTLDAAPATGINYYRLKQTDFDGAFEYSNIVNVTIGSTEPTAEITVYPNPANTGQQVQITIANSDTNFTIEIYEIGSGRLVYNAVTASQNNLLDVPQGLAAGAYLVRVANDVEVQNHKLLVR